MTAGVFGSPTSALVNGSVRAKLKVTGTAVRGEIEQARASPGPAARMVAKAVAMALVWTARPTGSTAAAMARPGAAVNAKRLPRTRSLALTMVAKELKVPAMMS